MEVLLGTPMLILGLAVGIWLITSARFRKSIGKSVTDTIEVHSKSMVEGAKFSAVKNKIDSMQELSDEGLTPEAVGEHVTAFDKLIA